MSKPFEEFIDYQLKQVEYEKELENKIVQLIDTILKTLKKYLLKVYYNELNWCTILEGDEDRLHSFLASINIINGRSIEITIFKLPINHIVDFINIGLESNLKVLKTCSKYYTEVYKLQTTFKTDDGLKLLFCNTKRKSSLDHLNSLDKEILISYLSESIEGEKGL